MTEINRSGSKTGQTSILGAADMNRLYHKISQEEKKDRSFDSLESVQKKINDTYFYWG